MRLKAALAHARFEAIHPFLDGNGRLGRLLITLVLREQKVLRKPRLYPSLYSKTHRPYYYELLNHVRLTGDWEEWLDFFAEAVIVTAAFVGRRQSLVFVSKVSREKSPLPRKLRGKPPKKSSRWDGWMLRTVEAECVV